MSDSIYRPESNEIESFREDLADNMRYLEDNLSHVNERDRGFAENLCSYYSEHDRLSSKQLYYALLFWREAKNAHKGTGSASY